MLRTINRQVDNSPSIFQRVAQKDAAAIQECVGIYGSLIWALAKKFTTSTEDAESATQEIFTDVWRYAEIFADSPFNEKLLIALIARQRLNKRLKS